MPFFGGLRRRDVALIRQTMNVETNNAGVLLDEWIDWQTDE